jgi:hypothetical protein
LQEAKDAEANDKIKRRIETNPSIHHTVFYFDPESWADISRRRTALDEAVPSGAQLQQAILTCHILTDIFILCSGTKDAASSSTYVQAIKALSDYMVFLIVMHPDTILGLEQRNLYEETRKKLEKIWHPGNERLASILRNRKHIVYSSVVDSGVLYARLLLDLVDMSKPDKPGVISSYQDGDHAAMDKLKRLLPDLQSSCSDGVFDMPKALELIFDAWVRLLISVSVRRSRDSHAGQINRGSDLTTIVWLMVEHAAVFLKPHENTEVVPLPLDEQAVTSMMMSS